MDKSINMIVRVLFGLLLFSVSLQGQTENDYGCAKTMLLNYKASNVKKIMYPEDTKVIKLSNISEVNNNVIGEFILAYDPTGPQSWDILKIPYTYAIADEYNDSKGSYRIRKI